MERQFVVTQLCGLFERQKAEDAFNTQSTRPGTGHQVKKPGIAFIQAEESGLWHRFVLI